MSAQTLSKASICDNAPTLKWKWIEDRKKRDQNQKVAPISRERAFS
jgi:hypothetical protein